MSFDFNAARQTMVESQVRVNDVPDLAIQDAMRVVARETLAPAGKQALAYADTEIEYAPGRVMMRPRDVAKLLQALAPQAGERALAIAAPYAGAVLQAMGLSVEACDGEDLTAIPSGPFDVIVCEGAVTAAPSVWTSALAEGGRLGVVERPDRAGKAMIYLNAGGEVTGRAAFDSMVPVLAQFRPATEFVF